MKISILKLNISLTGTSKPSLMDQLIKAEVAIASSCAGEAVCAKCVVEVHHGLKNLNPPNVREAELSRTNNFNKNQRLSCQCFLKGSVSISTPYW